MSNWQKFNNFINGTAALVKSHNQRTVDTDYKSQYDSLRSEYDLINVNHKAHRQNAFLIRKIEEFVDPKKPKTEQCINYLNRKHPKLVERAELNLESITPKSSEIDIIKKCISILKEENLHYVELILNQLNINTAEFTEAELSGFFDQKISQLINSINAALISINDPELKREFRELYFGDISKNSSSVAPGRAVTVILNKLADIEFDPNNPESARHIRKLRSLAKKSIDRMHPNLSKKSKRSSDNTR